MNKNVLINLENLKSRIDEIGDKIANLQETENLSKLEEEFLKLQEISNILNKKLSDYDIEKIDFEDNDGINNILVQCTNDWIKEFQSKLNTIEKMTRNEISCLARELRDFELSMYGKGYYFDKHNDVIREMHYVINSKLILLPAL